MNFIEKFLKSRQVLLAALLLSIHGVLVLDMGSPVQKTVMLCHYGLFLLWQPVWKATKTLSLTSALLLVGAGAALAYFLNGWLLAFWISGLFGLLGGRVFSGKEKSSNRGYLLAAGYLIGVLLMWIVPSLLTTKSTQAEFLALYILPVIIPFILFTKAEGGNKNQPQTLDFFYSLLLFLLSIILVLGCFALDVAIKINYNEMILRVLFVTAFSLFAVSWLWNPVGGFGGIGQLLSKYLLSLGLPFEEWVKNIAELAETKNSAQSFTEGAMRELSLLPWVSGVSWETDEFSGELGKKTEHNADLHFHDFNLNIHSRLPLTPALTLHIKLLTQILGEFYEAKRREEKLKQNAYMQAVYETGARLTHDIKNLVQSMKALCSAAEQTKKEDEAHLVELFKRQLPLLNQRLASTLDKLQAPKEVAGETIMLSSWWKTLQLRYAHYGVTFLGEVMQDEVLNKEVMDSVLENLLQNGLEKVKNSTSVTIGVVLENNDGLVISVRDTGKAVPEFVANRLFKQNISSENGLGIGLYHAAQQAEQIGFKLDLVENQLGNVVFEVRKI